MYLVVVQNMMSLTTLPFNFVFIGKSLSTYFVCTNDACLRTTHDVASGDDCFAF
jgi:hypothetical protein